MDFVNIAVDYEKELALLYGDRLDSDPIFDDDSFVHGHDYKYRTACYDDPSRRFEEYRRK